MTVWEKLWPTPSPGFDLPIRLVDTDVTFGGPRANGTETRLPFPGGIGPETQLVSTFPSCARLTQNSTV